MAMLCVTRERGAFGFAMNWEILVDNVPVAQVANGATAQILVHPGMRRVMLRSTHAAVVVDVVATDHAPVQIACRAKKLSIWAILFPRMWADQAKRQAIQAWAVGTPPLPQPGFAAARTYA